MFAINYSQVKNYTLQQMRLKYHYPERLDPNKQALLILAVTMKLDFPFWAAPNSNSWLRLCSDPCDDKPISRFSFVSLF